MESEDEQGAQCNQIGDKSCETDENSKAMVLYKAECIKLMPGVDLKVPPNNWLRAKSPIERYIHTSLQKRQSATSRSSINMAEDKIDSVDEIDVISDSKNIKSLLAIPFSDEPVSLMVHRVGKTLLLDEFDIHKHLLRQQQDDWKWLRNFYLSLIANQQIRRYQKSPIKNNKDIAEQNMFSKFLYYSIQSQSDNRTADNELEQHIISQLESIYKTEDNERTGAHKSSEDVKPEFTRTLEWNFEDIKMLIGSDLPIFRAGSSCISLRLRDENSPITVLTGLDYWLDNLMCNVPEIAMCYHSNGFVKRYERISTPDIPNLSGAVFEPDYVKDVAQTILSFLKSNATKVGHTYWLYKDKNTDIIKLYDLTSLCDGDLESKNDPFRIPLANLLFRVALRLLEQHKVKRSGIIETLLLNCLTLFTNEQPQQTITANLLLCELYMSEELSGETTTDTESEQSEDEEEQSQSVENDLGSPVSELHLERSVGKKDVKPDDKSGRFPPITAQLEDRCVSSLRHVSQGVTLVDNLVEKSQRSTPSRETQAHSRKSSTGAIPLPYESLHLNSLKKTDDYTELTSTLNSNSDTSLSVYKQLNKSTGSWHLNSKLSLLKKGLEACLPLAESRLLVSDYGLALRSIKLALFVYDTLTNLGGSASSSQTLHKLLMFCGDVHIKLSKLTNKQTYVRQWEEVEQYEKAIFSSCFKENTEQTYAWCTHIHDKAEPCMKTALRCYQLAHEKSYEKSHEKSHDRSRDQSRDQSRDKAESHGADMIIKRLGNCCNELSVFYMNEAARCYNEVDRKACDDGETTHIKDLDDKLHVLLDNSQTYVRQGIKYFTQVQDLNNVVLLMSNEARLLRLKAQFVPPPGTRSEFSRQERTLYEEAACKYREALTVLGRRDVNPQIYDLITFELSGVYCTVGSSLQDFTPQYEERDQIEREVADVMMKALKYCDTPSVVTQHVMRQYRVATIHHRLASLFHNSYRKIQATEKKARHMRSLADNHYNKARDIFIQLESYPELFRLNLEKIALIEYDHANTGTQSAKLKLMETALSSLLQPCMRNCLKSFQTEETPNEHDETELMKLLEIYISRVQFISLQLTKLSQKKSEHKLKNPHQQSNQTQMASSYYKSVYRSALAMKTSTNSSQTTQTILDKLDSHFET